MQLTLKLLDDAITRGWADTAHLSEIRDALRDEATFDLDTLEDKMLALQRKVDDVYSERNSLAVALAKVTLLHGGTAGRGFDNSPDKNWDPEWLNVVYVDVPGVGQVSWHMGPKDLQRLESLPAYTGKWDGTCIGKDPAWPDTIAPLAAAAPSPGPSVMELIGEYWDLGFTEGKTGVNQSDAANELLHRIRRALAQQPAAVPWDVLALLRDLAPALDAYERSGRKSEIKDGALHWTLDARHYDAQRLRSRIEAMLAAAAWKGE